MYAAAQTRKAAVSKDRNMLERRIEEGRKGKGLEGELETTEIPKERNAKHIFRLFKQKIYRG